MKFLYPWVCLSLALSAGAADKVALEANDHLSLIGNTLPDLMQHDGWLETRLQARFPEHKLVIRNLGFSGDEVALRLRSAGFGSPQEWLSRAKTDVIWAFFGHGESFGGEAGLVKFKAELEDFIKQTLAEKHNGKTPPRLVLFGPIAQEERKEPNWPHASENNRRLALYAAAMAEVAKARGVPFVDLIPLSRELYSKADRPLTINGIHLTVEGNRQLAEAIDRELFGPAKELTPEQWEKLRGAVRDKCFTWFERYRTVDGYSIYGGRADLRFVGGQTNRDVMQREMAILDVMTANRDARIWAVARGEDLNVDDSNTPPFLEVKTNKPGPLPGGKHAFLGGEEAIAKMTVAKPMKVNLFASEKEFPDLVNPVQMAWDAKGRLWVAVWPTYPHWKPKAAMNDKLLILEDTDGDGKADKQTVFAGDLHCPTGFEFYQDGVILAEAPYLVFLRDTDGDGKVDEKRRILAGLDTADTHHTSNSFVFDPGGAVYFQEGTFHHTQVESPYGPNVRCANAGVFRFEPRTGKFSVYVSHGFANPHGHIFDRWGQDIVYDGTGAVPYHAALFSGRIEYPDKHATPPQVYRQRTRPCPGAEVLSSKHFPDDMQGDLLVGNVIGFQGILRYKLADDGASFSATEAEPVLSSVDPNFRPSDMKIGPDGAIYFLDWHNPIIGHMQHNLRDPSRDVEHGRIYRVTYEGRPLSKSPSIAGEPITNVLDALKSSEARVRYRARLELASRPTGEVVPVARKWLMSLDKSDPDFEHHRLEILWLLQSHNVADIADLLVEVLASPDFRARAAATRVIGYRHDAIPDSLERLLKLAADPSPRVRLEAVRAASFFTKPEALEVLLVAAEQPSDPFVEFVRGESMRAIMPSVRRALARGEKLQFKTPAGQRYFVKSLSVDDLLRVERSAEVYRELLTRPAVREEFRREAVAGLAKSEKKPATAVLLGTIKSLDGADQPADEGVIFDLFRVLTDQPVDAVGGARGEIEKLALDGRRQATRQLALCSLLHLDGDVDTAWALTEKSSGRLIDLIAATPLIRDPDLRARMYPRLDAILSAKKSEKESDVAAPGRFVRIELPGQGKILTLAEVEVASGGKNVARTGKASQASTAHGGDASKALDGNKLGIFGAGGQTHTAENGADPWWEVDLGQEYPIEAVTVYNRTESALGARLEGYTLKVLDRNRRVVFEKTKNAAPAPKSALAIGKVAMGRLLRQAALAALPSIPGKEAVAAAHLRRALDDPADQTIAVEALLKIPVDRWQKEDVRPILERVLARVRAIPESERTGTAAVDAIQLAESLAAALPVDEARSLRRELGGLGVRVFRIGTVTDQMRYDRETFVVEAGRPFEILLENNDLMPHNLVIVKPGSLEEVGNQAEAEGTRPGAVDRGYVPANKKVLAASRLLPPRDAQRIRVANLTRPGVYPYVCTYPGHWRRMFGSVVVVPSLEEYLSDPAGYLASKKIAPVDEMLRNNRPRTDWKLEDLASPVGQLSGRSFAAGKQAFQQANCVACHQLNRVGQVFGPNLAKLDPKVTPTDILKSLLEPSEKIEDKFASYVFVLDSGRAVTGMVLEENAATVKVIENPLAGAQPTILTTSEIIERRKSPTSIMPKGLLDKLTREEILDLIAYVSAGGDPSGKAFHGAHHGANGNGSGH